MIIVGIMTVLFVCVPEMAFVSDFLFDFPLVGPLQAGRQNLLHRVAVHGIGITVGLRIKPRLQQYPIAIAENLPVQMRYTTIRARLVRINHKQHHADAIPHVRLATSLIPAAVETMAGAPGTVFTRHFQKIAGVDRENQLSGRARRVQHIGQPRKDYIIGMYGLSW